MMATTDEQLFDADLAADTARAQLRGRRKRRKRGTGRGAKLFAGSAAAVVGIVLLCGIVTKAAQPYQMQHQQARQIAQLRSQLSEANAQNADLERQTIYLQRPDGIENAARAEGFLKPGEVSLDIQANTGPSTTGASQGGGIETILRNAWQRWVK